MLVNCVSRKFATTHRRFSTNVMTCVPGATSCPGRTCRSPTLPSSGATIRGVTQIDLGYGERGLFSVKISNKLGLLRLEYNLAAALRFCCGFVAA